MAVHRVGKTLLIDELNAPLFFGEMVKVNRKDRLHGSRVQVRLTGNHPIKQPHPSQ